MSVAVKKAIAPAAPLECGKHVPNAETRKAIAEVEAGKTVRFDSVDGLFAYLEDDAE